MSLTKILGLAMVAVMAIAAFAGSANATRLHPLVKYCLEQNLLLCPDAKVAEPTGVLIELQIGIGVYEGTITQKCTGGTIQKELLPEAENMTEGPGAEESRLLGKITKITFTGCEPCKKITTAPPFTDNVRMTSEAEGAGWTLEGNLNFRFEECSFGVTCKFAAEKLEPAPIVEMSATESWVNTNKAVLKRTEGNELLCGNTLKWNAKFKLELELPDGKVHNISLTLCKQASVKCIV